MKTTGATKVTGDRFFWRFRVKSSSALGAYLLILFLLPLPISLSTRWSYGQAFNVVMAGSLASVLLIYFGRMTLGRPRITSLLLDTGPYPQRRLYILLASVWSVSAVLNLSFDEGIRSFITSQGLNLLLAAFFVLLSFGRLRVYKEGVWLYNGLLTWDRLKAYRWRKGTLYFETKGLFFWTQTSCTMPEKHIEAFEAYLLEYNIPDTTAELAVAT